MKPNFTYKKSKISFLLQAFFMFASNTYNQTFFFGMISNGRKLFFSDKYFPRLNLLNYFTENFNFLENKNLKSIRVFNSYFYILFFSILSMSVSGQVTRACWNEPGSSGEFTLNKIYLASDLAGTPLSSSACSSVSSVNVYLAASITNGTGSVRQGVFLAGTIKSDSDPTGTVYSKCFDIPLTSGSPTIVVDPTPYLWNCGDALTMSSTFIGWGSGSGTVCAADCKTSSLTGPKCRNYPDFKIDTPLVAKFTSNSSCPGGSQFGNINLTSTSTGGNGIYSYKWYQSTDGINFTQFATTQSATFSPGNNNAYYIKLTVTDSSTSVNTNSKTISNIYAGICCTTPVISEKQTSICSGQTFTISPAAGGSEIVPLGTTYSWPAPSISGITGTASGSNATNISSGILTNSTNNPIIVTYIVTPKSGACTGSPFNIKVTVKPKPILEVTNASVCNGTAATITATGTATGGTYLWSTGATTASITVSPSTTTEYTVIYTLNGCPSAQGKGTVTVKPIPAAPTVTVVNNCDGTSTLSTTAAGTLLWSTGATTSSIIVQNAGTYTLTTTNESGCTATATATINAAPTQITFTATPTQIKCNGGRGSVTLASSGGTGTLTYSGDATANLTAGTYNYTVTDANGCTATATATINAAPTQITFTATPTQIKCNGGTGNVTLASSGGTGTLTYSGSATANLTAGTYNYTVTDANGCTATGTATINVAPTQITFTATPTQIKCNGGTGTVTLASSGGTGTLTYSGDATASLTAGNYNYTVTDANGCTATATATINAAPTQITFTATPTQIKCNGGTGSVTLASSGGTGTLTYSGSATANLTAGTYNYTVTDANGCTATATATINAAPTQITFTATPTQIKCNGGTGSVTLASSGGTGTLTYSGDATANLTAGTYNYTVTDANGCTATATATINAAPTQI
ncbi:hypothetical protein SAMN05443667_1051, partial [Flavobacterium gillisiae]